MVGWSVKLHDILLAFYCALCASEQMQSTLQYVEKLMQPMQFKKPENTSIHSEKNLSTEGNFNKTHWQEMTRQ